VPSRIEEPSGYVIVEAAAHAVPCIATRKGGIPETAGPSALYYEAGDASALAAVMTRAISDPLLLEKLGVAARQYALENFDLSVAGAAFLTCISSKPADHRMARQHNAPPGARKAQRGATS
jgi:glycosyltransferase involved in cell wall biosynthesis